MKQLICLKPSYLYVFPLVVLFYFFTGIANALPNDAKIYLTISVDWEGRDLDPINIDLMNKFRDQHPELPLLHFLNAAYFTKEGIDKFEVRKKIRSVLREQDELGLHIHAWKSLVEASGVNYRHLPKWTPKKYHQRQIEACAFKDCGHEVPISSYSFAELVKIIETSMGILSAQGFPKPVSFRAGGWMASSNVLQALAHQGFLYDSSEVSYTHFKERLKDYAIPQWTAQLWPNASAVSQPYAIETGYTDVTEMPDNGCLADYMSADDMLKVFRENVRVWQLNPSKPIYIHFGFHQETAKKYLHRVHQAINEIKLVAKKQLIPLEFVTFSMQ